MYIIIISKSHIKIPFYPQIQKIKEKDDEKKKKNSLKYQK